MLENARNQFILVLLATIAALAAAFTIPPTLGADLKGGTQLLYDIPKDVLTELTEKEGVTVDDIMTQSISVMRERVDPNGTLDPLMTRSGETGILIELGEMSNQQLNVVLDRIRNLGRLEMRMVAYASFKQGNVAFNLSAESTRLKRWLDVPENRAAVLDDPLNIRSYNEQVTGGPGKGIQWFPRKLTPDDKDPKNWGSSYTRMPGLSDAAVAVWKEPEFNNGVIPEAYQQKEAKDRWLLEYIAVNMIETHFSGEDLDPSGVGIGMGDNGGPAVNYSIIGSKVTDYSEWSAEHIGECSAIILNGYVKSAPVFQGRIPGRGIIQGDFTTQEVEELVKVLRTGSLRVEPELLSKETIGAQLGDAAIQRGVISILGGGLLVFLFMLAYYRLAGLIACISLLLNVLLLYAGMLFMEATITLPGLGGIVLTLGMAVDANVLIYERIREELQKGKEMLQAVRAGFERAMSAILDSNITTFLIGLVLFNVGVGPVRGFAVTLMVGIVTTVFTQFFVSRLLFHWAIENKKLDGWRPRTLFENRSFDFVSKIKPCVVISAIVILGGLAFTSTVDSEKMLSIDFTGGANLRMVVSQPMQAQAIRDALANDEQFVAKYPTTTVNQVGEDGTQFNMRLKLNDSQREAIEQARAEYRDLRRQAEENGDELPPAYEPPYVAELRRLFADSLVQPAFSQPMLTPRPPARPGEESDQQYAQIDVHFSRPVSTSVLSERMQSKLSEPLVVPLPESDPPATEAKDFRIEWTTLASTTSSRLRGIIGDVITPPDADVDDERLLRDAEQKVIALSDPFPQAQEIQGRLVTSLRNSAIGALLLAWALIVFYLRVRFHEYKYGVAAVIALIHDVLVTFGFVVLFNHMGWINAEISLSMIAAFLTIIGYSVNDTIVVFDRIRENRIENARNGTDEPLRTLINRSLNQTLSRTVLTTGLTLIVVVAQLIVNMGSGSDLEGFAFAMTIGMCFGVYSTVFIAAPILIWMDRGEEVEVPEGPHDPSREGDYDNEAEIAAKEAAAAAAAEKNA